MLITLVALRLEIANQQPDLTVLKHYSVSKNKEKVKTESYASVASKRTRLKSETTDSSNTDTEISPDKKKEVQKEHSHSSRPHTEAVESRSQGKESATANKHVNCSKFCQGQRDFGDIVIELVEEKDLKQAIMDVEENLFSPITSPRDGKEESETSSNGDGKEPENDSSDQSTAMQQRETSSDSGERASTSQAGLPGNSSSSVSKRPKSHSPTTKTPAPINFVSGNPSVELTKGILHIYKESQMTPLDKDVCRSEMLCILGVPACHTIHDLIKFMAPMGDYVSYMQVLRGGLPNQYMLLIKFRSQAMADEFYLYFNNRPFNSIEPDICHLVYVSQVEHVRESQGGSLPMLEMTELPNCPVCLERMEESVDGILTVLCNHSFHTQCLAQWGDTSCPVCRYCQTPEEVADQRCMQCGSHESLWICLICGNVGCGRYVGLHAYKHFQDTNHTYAMQLGTSRVWDYAGDNYVHRLAQNKSDGKLVEVDEGGNELQAEKLDSITLEYTYLLTTQLESQRLYFTEQIAQAVEDSEAKLVETRNRWEQEIKNREQSECKLSNTIKEKQQLDRKYSQLHSKTGQAMTDLQEERQMNKCLRENQQDWIAKVQVLERKLDSKDQELRDMKEQLRDVMFYMEAQQKLASSPGISKEELQGGQVIVGDSPVSSASGGKKLRKKTAR